MTSVERQEHMKLRIAAYKKSFFEEFNAELVITTKIALSDLTKISLNDLGIIVDDVLHSNYPNQFPDGIKTKSRRLDVLNFRQCYCKIALDFKHTSVSIADALGIDHATVLHSNNCIRNMIATNNQRTVYNLIQINNELQERFGINADIQYNQPTKPNT